MALPSPSCSPLYVLHLWFVAGVQRTCTLGEPLALPHGNLGVPKGNREQNANALDSVTHTQRMLGEPGDISSGKEVPRATP